ncbi:MAG: putative O-glycosylation ligase, exosortase A system-associated [Acidobacteria bacterium]|nr:putative O-glycosylation ligase, exosortase A system-associated [Acidobacteriota bacterium]
MRQILILSILFLIIPLAFFVPFTGLVSYISMAYVRPHEWAYMPGVQISLVVALTTLAGYVIFELTRRAPQLIPNGLICLLWIQITLATLYAQSPQAAQGKFVEFSKTFLIALLLTAMVDSEKRVRWLLLGIVLSIGFLAFRSNAGILLTMGQYRIYGPGGAFEDNNDYALLLNMAAPIAFCVARGERNRWLRLICYALSVMMMITVIFTLSRGGYLGLAVVSIGLALKSKYKMVALAAVLVLGLTAYMIVPQQVVERVTTMKAPRYDESTQLRLDSWEASGRIINEHPIFGIGPRNILQAYDRYTESRIIRVSHNSFLQMAVDAGLPALLLFLGLIGLSYFRLRKSRQILKTLAPGSPLIAYSHGMEIALIGFIVSGNFLSRHDLELLYNVIALATSFRLIARDLGREAEARELAGNESQAFEPELVVR